MRPLVEPVHVNVPLVAPPVMVFRFHHGTLSASAVDSVIMATSAVASTAVAAVCARRIRRATARLRWMNGSWYRTACDSKRVRAAGRMPANRRQDAGDPKND